MKKILTSLLITFIGIFSSMVYAADEAPKTKQVCKDVLDKDKKPVLNKDGTTKQTCKTIKIHKKVEGTEIPPKK
jgi:hypothetical protein